MLYLYHSNRLEILADQLAEQLSAAPTDPFLAESVVVQHQGMGRWLSLQLAERLGICANLNFPLPAGYLWELLRAVLPVVPEQDHFQPSVMQWRLFELLPQLTADPTFAEVTDYLAGEDELRRFELAGELAAVFDQYLVYRPDWIGHWQAGREAIAGDHWQGELWRRLVADKKDSHWVGLGLKLAQLQHSGALDPSRLPPRVMLFAVASLSPGYLEILSLLSQQVDVHLYLLNPSEGHWVDLISSEEKARRELLADESDLYLDVGNPLLASLGGQGRDFFALLLEFDPGGDDHFVAPEDNRLLGQLQRDILEIIDGTQDTESRPIAADDRSLQLHVCHSPMREVEVLHDQLLGLFAADPQLQPDEVLVLTPDMDRYAPYIEAVFSDTSGEHYIPFSLADRGIANTASLVNGLFQLFALNGSRYDVNQVLALLEVPSLRRRFNIDESDLPMVSLWAERAGIRWGQDEGTRSRLGLPVTGQNSWQAGLDRLTLGYALPPEGSELFQGVRPCGDVEGADATLLGGVLAFTSALFSLQPLLSVSHPLDQWESLLLTLLDRFFLPEGEEEYQLQSVRESLSHLVEESARAGCQQPVTFPLVVDKLRQLLEGGGGQAGFLSGGITFCALTPMRALPFKVICMIGMCDGAFPRQKRAPGFDLMQGSYRPGDRSRRADDRYLFLETLLSARQTLYLSYVGLDIRDNSSIPPSVLVSEVLDYLDHSFVTSSGRRATEMILTQHPLQPFSPRYFKPDGPLFSYSAIHSQAARALLSPANSQWSFIDQPLSSPAGEWHQVELEQLIDCFTNPARYLLNRRLGVRIEAGEDELESRDPFTLGYMQRSEMFQRLVAGIRDGASVDRLHLLERASGELPHGAAGDTLFASLMASAESIATRLAGMDAAPPGEPIEIRHRHLYQQLQLQLSGTLTGISCHGFIGYSIEKLPDWRLVELWIRHLALNLSPTDEVAPVSRWFDDGRLLTFPPLADAAGELSKLLEIYWQGLSEPLHFFPKSSHQYAAALGDGKSEEQALQAAEKRWYSGFYSGECENPYYRLAFNDQDVLDSTFCTLSEAFFGPLLNQLEVS